MIVFKRLIIAMLIMATPLSGWAADATIQPQPAAASVPPSTVADTATPVPTRAELALFAMGLIGAVYKPGGDNPAVGMDCSGFVRYVYHEVAGLKLPHNALALSKIRNRIARADLKPGDLVFFKTMKHAFSHVGIYLGGNQFVHASSSKTGFVMVSNLDESYWAKHYEGARRVLPTTSPLLPTSNTSTNDAGSVEAVAASSADPLASIIR